MGGLLTGVLAYWIPCAALLLYVLKAEKRPLSFVGLKPVRARHVFEGMGLGICMFIVQQIPLLLMKMDLRGNQYPAFLSDPLVYHAA